ncbi:MAG: pyridoxal phosphate-dependent aminotransferase [Betaproteobacteria bacterium]|nr:pyridoxal phosphate-dependent aminotransferase [Betaproteobacteria bacterium]NBY05914.1 pyridoxal phosphate-dependent aminotransferase [Betaproteobacteria bacterium]
MRSTILNLEASKIRDVANAGLGRDDVLAFWFGESDEATPDIVRQAAIESLRLGETFYAHNLGLHELRHGIANHMTQKHPGPNGLGVAADRVAVTAGGVNALMLAVQALVDAEDDVLVITPVWPNLVAQPRIMGANLRTLALQAVGGRWQLDLDELLAAILPQTRLLILNAPNNPTGWTLGQVEQEAILRRCRETGTWILADEVYEALYFAPTENACAPSFLDVADPNDRLVVVHSFSKSHLMTGWRLGWLVMPPAMTQAMGKLIEFNTSCCPVFAQRAGVVALQHASEITPRVVSHLKICRDTLVGALQEVPGLELSMPLGGMYAFFRWPGHDNGVIMAKQLVAQAGLGLAPGEAFGPEAAGWLRWCFASKEPQRLLSGVDRLKSWMKL